MAHYHFLLRPRCIVSCFVVFIFLVPLARSQAQESSGASLPRRAGPMGDRIDPQITDRVTIHEVVAGSPAATVGLISGDTITSIAGKLVPTFETLRSVMRGLEGGQATTIEVLRQGFLTMRVDKPGLGDSEGPPKWTKLPTEPYPGKQDDIFFVDPNLGFYGNGAGKIFRTTDGGATWQKVFEQKGTFVRCLAFTDGKNGVMGNIGPGYFPGVTDPNPLYRTEDGGSTWSPVTGIDGEPVVGLCAFDIVQVPFVNAGNLDHRPRIIGVGRVGGPAAYIWSDDLGKTWKQGKLPEIGAMAFDVKFLDDQRGFIASATDADVAQSHALILATEDGGSTWREVYRSARPFELTWKLSFPTKEVGYCTIQSYDPDTSASARFIVKTTDGGKTWNDIPLVDDHRVREFGVAFLDANIGWVGALPHGFGTTDGGKSWSKVDFGNAVNKIRLIHSSEGVTGYAIGVEVHRVQIPTGD